RPDLTGYNSFSFGASKKIIEQGYKEAEHHSQALADLSLDELSWRQYASDRQSRRRNIPGHPEFVRVEGVVAADQAPTDKLLADQVAAPLNVEGLNDDLTKITGWGRYEVAGYTGKEEDGREGLDVQVQSKSYGPPFIKPAVEVNGA